MAHTADIVPFWPAWTRTLDEMIRRLARARSRCRRCHTLLHVDLEGLRGQLGGEASLINRTDACAVVGCEGTVYYLGAVATGAAYHVLVDEAALLEGVTDPVATPFRSRWHGMVPIGPDPSQTMVDDGVMVWCFAGPDMWALTDDEAGLGLPADLGPWTFRRHLTMDGTSPDEAEALRLIRDHGFCCFDPIPTAAKA